MMQPYRRESILHGRFLLAIELFVAMAGIEKDGPWMARLDYLRGGALKSRNAWLICLPPVGVLVWLT